MELCCIFMTQESRWFDFDYNNMPKFEDHMMKQVTQLNQRAIDNNASGQINLHLGRLVISVKEEGE